MGLPSQVTFFTVPGYYGGRTSSETAVMINGSTQLQQKKQFALATADSGKTTYREAGVAPSRASTIEFLSSTLKSGDLRRVMRVTHNRSVYDANGTLTAQKRPVTVQLVVDIPNDMVWGDPAVPSGLNLALDLLSSVRNTSAWPTTDSVVDGVTVRTVAEKVAREDLAAGVRFWLTGDLLR